jgi:hypothetical protein
VIRALWDIFIDILNIYCNIYIHIYLLGLVFGLVILGVRTHEAGQVSVVVRVAVDVGIGAVDPTGLGGAEKQPAGLYLAQPRPNAQQFGTALFTALLYCRHLLL